MSTSPIEGLAAGAAPENASLGWAGQSGLTDPLASYKESSPRDTVIPENN
jgi:hypothetical protein